jgi:hypothetical protein
MSGVFDTVSPTEHRGDGRCPQGQPVHRRVRVERARRAASTRSRNLDRNRDRGRPEGGSMSEMKIVSVPRDVPIGALAKAGSLRPGRPGRWPPTRTRDKCTADRRALELPPEPHLRRAADRLLGGSDAQGGAGRDAAGGRALAGANATPSAPPICAARRPGCGSGTSSTQNAEDLQVFTVSSLERVIWSR